MSFYQKKLMFSTGSHVNFLNQVCIALSLAEALFPSLGQKGQILLDLV